MIVKRFSLALPLGRRVVVVIQGTQAQTEHFQGPIKTSAPVSRQRNPGKDSKTAGSYQANADNIGGGNTSTRPRGVRRARSSDPCLGWLEAKGSPQERNDVMAFHQWEMARRANRAFYGK